MQEADAQAPGSQCPLHTFPTLPRNSSVPTFPTLPPLEFIPVHHSLVHTEGPHNQICKKSRKDPLQQAPNQHLSFLTLFKVIAQRRSKGGDSGTWWHYSITIPRIPGTCREGRRGGVCDLENSKVNKASATAHQGIRCHPGLGLLEAQSQRSLACGHLATGGAEPGTA